MNYELTMLKDASSPKPLTLKWWSFRQNNSGGYFDVDDNVSIWLHIESFSVDDAIAKLENITSGGSYSCPCCGERWSTYVDEEDGNPEPMIYGDTLKTYEDDTSSSWFKESSGNHRLHFYDGRVAAYKVNPVKEIE